MLLLPEAEVVEHMYDVAGVVLVLLTEVSQYPGMLLPEAEVVEHVNDVAGVVLILLTEVFQYPNLLLCLPVESLLVSHLQKAYTFTSSSQKSCFISRMI